MQKSVRIGNSSGFWGDDPTALYRQVVKGHLDYITADYLAEVSMSILQKQQEKNPDLGYVFDFIEHLIPAIPYLKKHRIRLITNAGGNNPEACAKRVLAELQKAGISLRVAYVSGDNIVHRLGDIYQSGETLAHFENQKSIEAVLPKIKSANAYVGYLPILKALELGADIIISGRATDSALAIAPMVYELKWNADDWDKLGSGMLAAHVIECGTQATGGNFTDWEMVESWVDFGFPIIEMFENGDFIVSKHPDTGGMVTVETVKEQLVYEIADPQHYFSPDVISDITHLKIKSIGENKVKVSGGRGKAPSALVKISASYDAGFSAMGSIIISGPKALEKAKVFEKAFWKRLNLDFKKKNTEFVGYNACHLDMANAIDPNEIVLRFHVFDGDRKKIETFSKFLSSLILSGPQGVAVMGGRPKVQQVMAYWPTLIHKNFVPMEVVVLKEDGAVYQKKEISLVTGYEQAVPQERDCQVALDGQHEKDVADGELVFLNQLCLARSGDKGNASNIGLLVRHPELYAFVKEKITARQVKQWFSSLCKGKVKRYEIENLHAFNFMLEESLDGGGTQSMRIDAQGKTFAAALLNRKIWVPKELLVFCSKP